MSFFFLILTLEWLAGFGLIASLGTRMPRSMAIPLAPLVGMFLHTVALFVVELLPWGIGPGTMTLSLVAVVIATHARWPTVLSWYKRLVSRPQWTLQMYDIVVILGLAITAYVVSWAAWFWPVTPFDAMAGIDLVARETVTEGTINNRVFTDPSLSGLLSNQPFYAPFTMLMQVIYRLVGFGYGQVWLAVCAICFSGFLYNTLRQLTHPFIAGVLWLLAVLTPELLGYTYLLQTDYINAAYLASAVILLAFTVERENVSAIALSAVLFAAACWSRTETILLVGMGLVAVAPYLWNRIGKGKLWTWYALIGALCLLTFAGWNGVFVQWVLPVHPDTAQEIVAFNFGRFAMVMADLFSSVIINVDLWGVAFPLFATVILASFVVTRSWQPVIPVIIVLAFTIGLAVIGTVFTAAIVEQTLRRGIFKLIPLMFLAVAWTPLVERIGRRLLKWETGQ